MFDTLTTADLNRLHNEMFEDHGRRYRACMAIPLTHPAYRARRAAMDELGETMTAIYGEIQRRDQENAHAV